MITRFAVLCLSLFATQVWASDKPFACDGTLSITNGEVRCVTTSTQESAPSFYETRIITTVAKQLVTTYETQIPRKCVIRVLRGQNRACQLEVRGFHVKEATVSLDPTKNIENSHLPAIRITNERWVWTWTIDGAFALAGIFFALVSLGCMVVHKKTFLLQNKSGQILAAYIFGCGFILLPIGALTPSITALESVFLGVIGSLFAFLILHLWMERIQKKRNVVKHLPNETSSARRIALGLFFVSPSRIYTTKEKSF